MNVAKSFACLSAITACLIAPAIARAQGHMEIVNLEGIIELAGEVGFLIFLMLAALGPLGRGARRVLETSIRDVGLSKARLACPGRSHSPCRVVIPRLETNVPCDDYRGGVRGLRDHRAAGRGRARLLGFG